MFADGGNNFSENSLEHGIGWSKQDEIYDIKKQTSGPQSPSI